MFTSSTQRQAVYLTLILVNLWAFSPAALPIKVTGKADNPMGGVLPLAASIRPSANLPAHLRIPKIDVDAPVERVGLTPDGAIGVPTNGTDVGWLTSSPSPGQLGSAIIDGHLDNRDGSAGVFQRLKELTPGDKIYVEDGTGVVRAFVVWQTKTYDQVAQPAEVFSSTSGSNLNLITCTGIWDMGKQSYSNRLVVFTSLEKSKIN